MSAPGDQALDSAMSRDRARHHCAMRAEIERQREGAAHVVEPVGQPLRRLAPQEIVRGEHARGTRAVAAHGTAVEDERRHGSGLYAPWPSA
jgi:hypothetical protein